MSAWPQPPRETWFEPLPGRRYQNDGGYDVDVISVSRRPSGDVHAVRCLIHRDLGTVEAVLSAEDWRQRIIGEDRP